MHRNGHFFCLKRWKKIPFLGYTRKMREFSVIPVRIINYFRLWGNNCVICLSLKVWASNFIVVITYNWFKIVFVEYSDWHFSCVSFQAKKVAISVHAWEKIMNATLEEHDNSHSCFCALASFVRNFTLVRIILFLPCSINIYSSQLIMLNYIFQESVRKTTFAFFCTRLLSFLFQK